MFGIDSGPGVDEWLRRCREHIGFNDGSARLRLAFNVFETAMLALDAKLKERDSEPVVGCVDDITADVEAIVGMLVDRKLLEVAALHAPGGDFSSAPTVFSATPDLFKAIDGLVSVTRNQLDALYRFVANETPPIDGVEISIVQSQKRLALVQNWYTPGVPYVEDAVLEAMLGFPSTSATKPKSEEDGTKVGFPSTSTTKPESNEDGANAGSSPGNAPDEEYVDFAEIAKRLADAGYEITKRTLSTAYSKKDKPYKDIWGPPDKKKGVAYFFIWSRLVPILNNQFAQELKSTLK
ncbi:MAG: hypothetical protein KDB01_16175 [Planctomycetaceae bacterium]|nr:hypothetical protein [Planctomycetaceae bacterium]